MRLILQIHNPIELLVFSKVIQLKSFSAAAESLGMSSSVISKHISRLEQGLGVRLLNRTTRRLSLTDAGQAILGQCIIMSRAVEETVILASEFATEPRGMLRISAPSTFGSIHLAPALPELLQRYPGLSIDLVLSDKLVDMVEQRFDVALTSDIIPGANLVVRKLAPISWIVCATDGYLQRHGTPQNLRDLEQHNCVFFSSEVTPGNEWRFRRDGVEHAILVRGNFRVNNSFAVREAVAAGIGIGLLPTFVLDPANKSQKLIPLLIKYEPTGLFHTNLLAHYVAGKFVPAKVRVCIDFLVDRFN